MDYKQHEEDLKELASLAKKMKQLSDKIVERVDARVGEHQAREEKWKKLEAQMEENSNKVASKVVLDVGGKRFATSKETLLSQEDTYFSALLQSGRYKPDEGGAYFIDRNPKYFSIILEYLRTGKLTISHLNNEQMENLKVELDYYQMPEETIPSSAPPSVIISGVLAKQIERWAQKTMGKPLWRGSLHGFSAHQFHSRCDHKGPTVVIVQSTQGWIFGGYASYSWCSSEDEWAKTAPVAGSFLFTLTNPNSIPPTKYRALNNNCLHSAPNTGPLFGNALSFDLCVNGNTANGSFSDFPANFDDTTMYRGNTFTGAKSFTIKDVEVYEMK